MTNTIIDKIIKMFQSCNEVLSLALGGSRARGLSKETSDYDLFVILTDEAFYGDFYATIDKYLVKDCDFIVSAFMHYQQNWGYLHKGYDIFGMQYDISYLPISRLNEMGIKSSNKIFFDKTGAYTHAVIEADDDFDQQIELAKTHRTEIVQQTMIFVVEYKKAEKAYQYWEQIKFLERFRRNIMILSRQNLGTMSKHYFSPEKNYEIETSDYSLREIYKFGDFNKIKNTFKLLKERFLKLLTKSELESWELVATVAL